MDSDPEVTLRTTDTDGTIRETKLTPGQAMDLAAGKPIAYVPRDETTGIDDEGQFVHGEDARPQYPEAA